MAPTKKMKRMRLMRVLLPAVEPRRLEKTRSRQLSLRCRMSIEKWWQKSPDQTA